MSKRFTPKASDYTRTLEATQRRVAELRRELAEAEHEERALRAFLLDYYDLGKTKIEYPDGQTMVVNLRETTQEQVDQAAVRALLTKLHRKVPLVTVEITTMTVRSVTAKQGKIAKRP